MHTIKLDEHDYERFRTLVQTRCGLTFPEHKRMDLTQGLRFTCRDRGISDVAQLYAALLDEHENTWNTLIMHLTIGETYFFRNQPQFAALRDTILPELMQRRTMSQNLRIWSAGCATGEEPYSIAMVLSELFQHHPGWQASLLATDINQAFLARAQAAVYGAWSFRDTPDTVRDRYFLPEQRHWLLRPEIRRMVRFATVNLAQPDYPSVSNGTCAMDLIVCRNVTIYFDEVTTQAVVNRLYNALTPGGWLIVGHSEPQISVYRQFEVHNFPDTVVYRKPLNAPLMFPGSIGLHPQEEAPPAPTAHRPALLPSPTGNALISPSPTPAPQPPVSTLLSQAQASADQALWDAAAAQCQRILDGEPLLVQAHYLLGHVLEHQEDLDGALAAYRRTLYLDPSFVMGMIGMGHVWRKKGRFQDAQRCYRNALAQLQRLPAGSAVPGAETADLADIMSAITHLLQTVSK